MVYILVDWTNPNFQLQIIVWLISFLLRASPPSGPASPPLPSRQCSHSLTTTTVELSTRSPCNSKIYFQDNTIIGLQLLLHGH